MKKVYYCTDCNGDCKTCEVILHPWNNSCLEIIREKQRGAEKASENAALLKRGMEGFNSVYMELPYICDTCYHKTGVRISITFNNMTQEICPSCYSNFERAFRLWSIDIKKFRTKKIRKNTKSKGKI